MRLLSVDPGGAGAGHTGIVLLDVPTDGPPVLVDSWAVSGGLSGFLEWYDTTGSKLRPDKVICEHFVNRNVKGADLTPCFIEGAVRAFWREVILQPASGKNTAVPNAVLDRLGLNDFKGDNHADRREATRHAIWYLKKSRHRCALMAGWN